MYKYQKKADFLLGKIYFSGDYGYPNFVAFAPMLGSLTVDNNQKVTNWISTKTSSEKIKLFDTNLELSMSNLANGRVTLKLNSYALAQKNSSLYRNFILNS